MKSKYSDYKIALAELDDLVARVVIDSHCRDGMRKIIRESFERKTVPVRGILQMLMDYRKANNSYVKFTESEREAIKEISDFWG